MDLKQLNEIFPKTFGLLNTINNEEGKYIPVELLITALVTLNEDTEYLNGEKQGKSNKPIPVSTVNNEDLLMEYIYMYIYTANRILKENKESIKKSSERIQTLASELQAEYARIEPIIKPLKKEVEDLQKKEEALKRTKEEEELLQSQKNHLSEFITKLEDLDIPSLKKTISQLKYDLKGLTEQKESLNATKTSLENEHRAKTLERDSTKQQNTNLSKEIEELRGEIEELEHKNAILCESKETFQKDKERLDIKKINDEWDELSNEAKSIVSIWNAFINDCDVNDYFQPKTSEPTEQLHGLRLLVDKDMEKLENLVNTQSKAYGDFLQRWEAKYK